MTEPAAPVKAKKSLVQKLQAVLAWALSRKGGTEIAAVVGAIGTVYAAVHRAGL